MKKKETRSVFLSIAMDFLRHGLVLAVFLLISAEFSASTTTQKVGSGYRLVSVAKTVDGCGLAGLLQVKQLTDAYGPDIRRLKLTVRHETKERLRVHITDVDKDRREVPYDLLPRERVPKTEPPPPSSPAAVPGGELAGEELVFSYSPDPFSFTVRRKSNGDYLFDTSNSTLVFKDQYLEISTRLPGDASLYGLGENTQPGGIKLRPNDPYTLYTTDISAINLNMDLYGSHPFYMDLRGSTDPTAHGVLLLNSNGMDVFYRGTSLTYKVIGGVFDFYFFSGESPLAVVDQYTALIGRPAPIPYWAFGFHQCRWGYRNVSVVEKVVEGYQKAAIPLDVIWNDDDHMDNAKDFTLDPVNYPRGKLLAFLDRIHDQGMKYIVLIDPGIAVDQSYGVFKRAMAGDVFIKYKGRPFLAQVWPGPVYFPDFLNPAGVAWWAAEVARFRELVPVDGLWIDMNEVSNFCSGDCEMPTPARPCPVPGSTTPWVCCLVCKNITQTRWDSPPYRINASGAQVPLGFKTIAASATHYNGVREYDAHSLYGLSQAVATRRALQSTDGKRPFVLTRSTFVGSGAHAAHWTGDNKGTWQDLRYSISTMLNFGLFGMPMVGADICGFYPAPTEELCNRWIELGAFYPFSRDHANFYSPRQELYVWDSVAESARNALGMRYRLLPYLYTLSYRANLAGAPVARPVFFSFPGFEPARSLSTQFLLGPGLMVSPVLEPGVTHLDALFPPGTWFSLFDLGESLVSREVNVFRLRAGLHEINVHLYEGHVIPMQRGGLRSREARATPFSLVVALGGSVEAVGEVFVDDDERPEMALEEGEATLAVFKAEVRGSVVRVWSEVTMGSFAQKKGLVVEKVTVLGLKGAGKELEMEIEGEKVMDIAGAKVDAGSGLTVEVAGLALPLGKNFALTWKMEIGG
ncbi:alpha-xylosidase 1 [Wolffia australiana]